MKTIIRDSLEELSKYEFITLLEFSNLIRMGRRRLRYLIFSNGDHYPTPYQFGGQTAPWCFKKEDVLEWIEKNKVGDL